MTAGDVQPPNPALHPPKPRESNQNLDTPAPGMHHR